MPSNGLKRLEMPFVMDNSHMLQQNILLEELNPNKLSNSQHTDGSRDESKNQRGAEDCKQKPDHSCEDGTFHNLKHLQMALDHTYSVENFFRSNISTTNDMHLMGSIAKHCCASPQ
jgi:hypothetical protein